MYVCVDKRTISSANKSPNPSSATVLFNQYLFAFCISMPSLTPESLLALSTLSSYHMNRFFPFYSTKNVKYARCLHCLLSLYIDCIDKWKVYILNNIDDVRFCYKMHVDFRGYQIFANDGSLIFRMQIQWNRFHFFARNKMISYFVCVHFTLQNYLIYFRSLLINCKKIICIKSIIDGFYLWV